MRRPSWPGLCKASVNGRRPDGTGRVKKCPGGRTDWMRHTMTQPLTALRPSLAPAQRPEPSVIRVSEHTIEVVSDSGEGAQKCGQIFAVVSAKMGNGVWTVEIIPAEVEPPPRIPEGASGNRIRLGTGPVTNWGDATHLVVAFNEQVLLGRVKAAELKPGCTILLESMWREHHDPKVVASYLETVKLLGEGGYFRVVLIHHPPNQEQAHPRLGLYGARDFRRVIAENGAELILHGHTHQSSIYAIPGPHGDVPVVGVAAAGAAQNDSGGHDPARYNLFAIQRLGTAWQCNMREFGFQRLGTDIVLRLSVRIY